MPDEKKKESNAKKAEASEAMKTVYTHGKKFKIPMSKDVNEFLKEKYPNEYK